MTPDRKIPEYSHPHFFEKSDDDSSAVTGDNPVRQQALPGLPPTHHTIDTGEPVVDFLAESAMTMVDHIAELRSRVLVSAVALAAAMGVGYSVTPMAINQLQRLAPKSTMFIQVTMGESLMTMLAMSVYIGFALAAPVILYNVLRFMSPGLHKQERTMLSWSLISGTILFLLGVVFAYFYVLPPAIDCLLAFGKEFAAPSLSIREFVSFCAALLMVTGLMFELPMALFLLSFTGLVSSAKLIKEWRWAIVSIFLVAAIVTPTQDPLSMSIVGLAMVGLYVLSIIPIKLCGR